MKLTIDQFKCPSLNKSYAGRHWSKRYAEARTIQELVGYLCAAQEIGSVKMYPVDIRITASYKSKIRRDSGNISNKEIIDGLVLAGVLEDDSTKYVRWVATRAIIGKEDKVKVEIMEVIDHPYIEKLEGGEK